MDCLIIVDMQNLVIGHADNAPAAIENMHTLLQRANNADVPVIWVQDESGPLTKGSTQWAIIEEFTVLPHHHRVGKTTGDGFASSELGSLLRDLGCRMPVICGAMSHACVRATATGALYAGYNSVLVSDAHCGQSIGDVRADDVRELVNKMMRLVIHPEHRCFVRPTSEIEFHQL
ncbi:cysteine hydrolase family protein [Corynebacterium aquilae]|uniref:cysteine hydrolase family protein n=1 Tax=Corynebacterium aquilae TaxID=203263 RepID=UPI0009511E0E|nr:isochorismatase family protein [Corynebacterium aquilae]